MAQALQQRSLLHAGFSGAKPRAGGKGGAIAAAAVAAAGGGGGGDEKPTQAAASGGGSGRKRELGINKESGMTLETLKQQCTAEGELTYLDKLNMQVTHTGAQCKKCIADDKPTYISFFRTGYYTNGL
eukprot:gene123-7009_t